jgi:outer membrane protein OmpA-like peptidoglycan-associated protein/Tol biopolymer transport system component
MKPRQAFPLLLGLAALQGQAQVMYDVEALDIRPAGEDFAPTLVDSGLVITSIRPRAQAIAYTDAATNKPLADLYTVSVHDGKPGHPHLLDGTLCSKFNDGPAAFTPGGDTICFTRNSAGGKRGAADRLALFFATRKGREWSEPIPFAYNGSDFSVMDASFSPDGQLLYFASDRPGGQGGVDLYMCRRDSAGWTAPENLGLQVNSTANELFPSAQADGRLVFASDRDGGLGKLDLYACAKEDGMWIMAKALPAPLNSPGNDLGYAAFPDGQRGYFSSDRGGTDQILRFTQKPEPFHDCTEQVRNSYCFHFEDEGAANTDTLPLRYVWDLGDGTKVAALTTNHCFVKPGTYTVKLDLVDTLSENVYYNQVSYDLEVTDEEQANINALDSAGTGQPILFDTGHTNLPGFTPQEVHWDLGDSSFATGAQVEHGYAQAGIYTVRLDLIGGPDGRGGYEHHCVSRTMKVIDGIQVMQDSAGPQPIAATTGLSKRSTAEVSPAAVDTTGKSGDYSVQLLSSSDRIDLGDARFMPIRPYYPVVERFVPKLRYYTYSIGSGNTALSVYSAYQLAKRANFTESEVKQVAPEEVLDLAHLDKLPLSALNNGVLRFSTVRFKTGESTFDPAFNTTLDTIIAVVLKYPSVDLVIEAHTDDQGSAESNLGLSQARAQSIVDYFLAKGIDAGRLSPVGMGEGRPIATNTTIVGRAQNRRVEFRLSVHNMSDNEPR